MPFADARAADVRYVGTSSDVPFCKHGGHAIDTCVGSRGDTLDAYVEVALSTWGAWRSPVGYAQFYVWWDIDSDGTPRRGDEQRPTRRPLPGRPRSSVQDRPAGRPDLPALPQERPQRLRALRQGHYWDDNAVDRQPLNGIGGSLDTSPYDSDAMVLPVTLNSLERAGWDIDHRRGCATG